MLLSKPKVRKVQTKGNKLHEIQLCVDKDVCTLQVQEAEKFRTGLRLYSDDPALA